MGALIIYFIIFSWICLEQCKLVTSSEKALKKANKPMAKVMIANILIEEIACYILNLKESSVELHQWASHKFWPIDDPNYPN